MFKLAKKLFLTQEIGQKQIQLENHFNMNKQNSKEAINTEVKIRCEISRMELEKDSLKKR